MRIKDVTLQWLAEEAAKDQEEFVYALNTISESQNVVSISKKAANSYSLTSLNRCLSCCPFREHSLTNAGELELKAIRCMTAHFMQLLHCTFSPCFDDLTDCFEFVTKYSATSSSTILQCYGQERLLQHCFNIFREIYSEEHQSSVARKREIYCKNVHAVIFDSFAQFHKVHCFDRSLTKKPSYFNSKPFDDFCRARINLASDCITAVLIHLKLNSIYDLNSSDEDKARVFRTLLNTIWIIYQHPEKRIGLTARAILKYCIQFFKKITPETAFDICELVTGNLKNASYISRGLQTETVAITPCLFSPDAIKRAQANQAVLEKILTIVAKAIEKTQSSWSKYDDFKVLLDRSILCNFVLHSAEALNAVEEGSSLEGKIDTVLSLQEQFLNTFFDPSTFSNNVHESLWILSDVYRYIHLKKNAIKNSRNTRLMLLLASIERPLRKDEVPMICYDYDRHKKLRCIYSNKLTLPILYVLIGHILRTRDVPNELFDSYQRNICKSQVGLLNCLNKTSFARVILSRIIRHCICMIKSVPQTYKIDIPSYSSIFDIEIIANHYGKMLYLCGTKGWDAKLYVDVLQFEREVGLLFDHKRAQWSTSEFLNDPNYVPPLPSEFPNTFGENIQHALADSIPSRLLDADGVIYLLIDLLKLRNGLDAWKATT